ncbi:MAG TPA: cytochrome c oxidase assembly protein [Gemmatimonadales bacterium]|nr:cytochrome c oxidase assembly protein [Gemmatimonadales bacterium]
MQLQDTPGSSEHAVQPPAPAAPSPQAHNQRMLLVLLGVIVVVVALVMVVLVPLYNLLCRQGGFQIRPNNAEVAAAGPAHTGRFLEVFFESKVLDGLQITFWADEPSQKVEVGVPARNIYHFRNQSNQIVHFRPIHQVSPGNIGQHFGMLVCFCFNDQTMEPGATADFPVEYRFDPALDERVRDVTICYSLLSIVEGETKEQSEARVKASTIGQGTIVTPAFRDIDR